MAISRKAGKSIMDELMWKYYDSRTDSYDYKRMEIDSKIDQILETEKRLQEIRDGIQEQS